MDPNTFPTKGNLILTRNMLRLSKQGYDLLDKKRNVLIKEIMELDERIAELQADIETVFSEAYDALRRANISMGIESVARMSYGVAKETSVRIRRRSVMGVELPMVSYDNTTAHKPYFGLLNTTVSLDEAFDKFNRAKDMIIRLSEIENSAYRLAMAIRKTQKRANALKNITIPKYEALAKSIQETLEERERDEFTRLKVIKRNKR